MKGPAPLWRWDDPLEPVRRLLERGGILAVPTESSYALAVDPTSSAGVEAVFRLKGRSTDKPLPVVIGELEHLRALGGDPQEPRLRRLASAWPAPLTLVVAVTSRLPAAAGRGTLGVRIPGHRPLRELLLGLGHGLTATSANRSGEAPALELESVRALVSGRDALVIDGGDLRGGPPSTVLALTPAGVEVLRPGGYPLERVERLLGLDPGSGFSAATEENPADDPC